MKEIIHHLKEIFQARCKKYSPRKDIPGCQAPSRKLNQLHTGRHWASSLPGKSNGDYEATVLRLESSETFWVLS